MTAAEVFNALSRGGAFSLPYLIEIRHPTQAPLFFVNNIDDVVYNGHTYHAASFKYTRPATVGGVLKNGALEIGAIDNGLIDMFEESDELVTLTAVGVIDQAGEVTPINIYRHQYGTLAIDEKMSVTMQFTNDDRLDMAFPPYVFDADNNRGNA